MKLSELIRQGSKDRRQARLGFVQPIHKFGVSGEQESVEYAACALGAACFACGVNEVEIKALMGGQYRSSGATAHDILGRCTDVTRLERTIVDCPPINDKGPITTIVVSLNDYFNWSFEQIIEWLESIGE